MPDQDTAAPSSAPEASELNPKLSVSLPGRDKKQPSANPARKGGDDKGGDKKPDYEAELKGIESLIESSRSELSKLKDKISLNKDVRSREKPSEKSFGSESDSGDKIDAKEGDEPSENANLKMEIAAIEAKIAELQIQKMLLEMERNADDNGDLHRDGNGGNRISFGSEADRDKYVDARIAMLDSLGVEYHIENEGKTLYFHTHMPQKFKDAGYTGADISTMSQEELSELKIEAAKERAEKEAKKVVVEASSDVSESEKPFTSEVQDETASRPVVGPFTANLKKQAEEAARSQDVAGKGR